MDYMSRNPRQRSDPRLLLEDVQSVVSVGINYYNEPEYNNDRPYVSIYARGKPYQEAIKSKLKTLLEFIKLNHHGIKGKIAVDTSPTFDKMWAERAGLGWRGKNTLLINKNLGSFIFLGELFLNIEIEPDLSGENLCADCRKCLDACPTGALEQPHLLNAARCISYLTTQAKGNLSTPELIGNHILGCDLCQLACPYNQSAPITNAPEFLINRNPDYFNRIQESISEDEFKCRYSGTILYKYGYIKYVNMVRIIENNLNSIKSS